MGRQTCRGPAPSSSSFTKPGRGPGCWAQTIFLPCAAAAGQQLCAASLPEQVSPTSFGLSCTVCVGLQLGQVAL